MMAFGWKAVHAAQSIIWFIIIIEIPIIASLSVLSEVKAVKFKILKETESVIKKMRN